MLLKMDKDRDAYIEWSSIVEAPVAIGTRAEMVTEHGEDRVTRADKNGTSARYYTWLSGYEQEGGWEDHPGLIYMQRGMLPRARFGDVYDLLVENIEADIPGEWLTPL